MDELILAINPGSTSTKIALYRNEKELWRKSVTHAEHELVQYEDLYDQAPMRKTLVLSAMAEQGVSPAELTAVVGRGGLLPPVKPGGYRVGDAMIDELESGRIVPHASNLGAVIAAEIARPLGIPAYIYDAVSSGNLSEVAKVTGVPEITRQSFCHVLNARASARKVAARLGRRYEDLRFVVAHLGGGVSISGHRYGEICDSAGDDDGAFSPERSGGVPLLQLIRMCYSGQYTEKEMMKKVRGSGGLKAHLGTSDCQQIEQMIRSGDHHAEVVYRAQAYQVAKGIGLMAAAMKGEVDCIVLTGGVAYSTMLTGWITEHVCFIAPVEVEPGENELEALALGALRIQLGQEQARTYPELDV